MREVILTPSEFKKATGIHITVNHTGKMSGMQSLSTSCLHNKYCQSYSKDPDKVCSHCFAQRQMKMYKTMDGCLEKNGEILCNRVLRADEMPVLNAKFFRFEAFGDIANETQVINYFNIAKANKDTNFAIWTKNPFLIAKAIENGHKKPRNLQIILSSCYLNRSTNSEAFPFVDKIFTVYDKNFAKENDVAINCGARSCLKCGRCYKKSKGIEHVNEILK